MHFYLYLFFSLYFSYFKLYIIETYYFLSYIFHKLHYTFLPLHLSASYPTSLRFEVTIGTLAFGASFPLPDGFGTAPVRNVHARCVPIKSARNQSERFTYCLCLYIFLLAAGGVSGSTFVIETTDSGIMILNTSPSINSGSAPLYIKVYWFRDSRISCLFHEPLFYKPTLP